MKSICSDVSYAVVLILSASSAFGQDRSQKPPIPDGSAQVEATKLIKEVYGDEWAAAKNTTKRQALAKKMIVKANETQDDPAGKFVLLRLARDIATQSNDSQTAFHAIDAMAEGFQVDVFNMKLVVLTKCASYAEKPEHYRALLKDAMKLLDQAVSEDNFDVAGPIGEFAASVGRKVADKEPNLQVQRRLSEVAELAKEYAEYKTAVDTLGKMPDDPEANLVVGKHLCFIKGEWEKGLAKLGIGKDEDFKALAKREFAGVALSSEQAKLGDAWWNLAEKRKGPATKQIQARAVYWYRHALPGTSGLMKDKIEKRMAAATVVSNGESFDKDTSDKWLEVVPHINVSRDRVEGGWKLANGKVATDAVGCSRIMLPVTVEGGYDLSLQYTRSRCRGGVVVILPVADVQGRLWIGGWGGRVSGLDGIDDKSAYNNSTTRRNDNFVIGRSYTLLVKVRVQDETGSLTAFLDGAQFIQWSGKLSSLTSNKDWALPQIKRPALAAHEDPVFFQSVKLRAATGTVSFVKTIQSRS